MFARAVLIRTLLAIFGMACPMALVAQTPLLGVFRFGLEHGGERVIEFEYEDGSTPDVTAGGGLLLSVGALRKLYKSGSSAVEAQALAGMKIRTIPPATNQEANWIRFPLEGMLFYSARDRFRIGTGITMHLHNVLAARGEVLNDRVAFRSKPGWVLEGGYINDKNMAFDLRYTSLKYPISEGGSGTVDASSIGLGASFFLGRRRNQ